MRSFAAASFIGFASIASFASAAPFSFQGDPLHNGFPNSTADEITQIEKIAHGTLPSPAPAPPNAPPAKPFSSDTITSLRFIAFNEIFEVAFFQSLIHNITIDAPGFKISNATAKKDTLFQLTGHQAQEEMHAYNAQNALMGNKKNPIQPCQYVFPTTKLDDAIALASKFTDIVLATLPDLQTGFAVNNDSGLIRGVGSVIGQEGEQNGFYRRFGKANKSKLAAALPFLTAGTRNFAFSALNQNFIVPGSCPNIKDITDDKSVEIFAPLTVITDGGNLAAKEQTVQFTFPIADISTIDDIASGWKDNNYAGLSLVYINQQNAPVVEKLMNVQPMIDANHVVSLQFEANFPFDGVKFGNGLTLAALTPSSGGSVDLTTVVGVSKAAIAGPGLIEIN